MADELARRETVKGLVEPETTVGLPFQAGKRPRPLSLSQTMWEIRKCNLACNIQGESIYQG